jgi:hypothetical protein
VLSPTLVEQTIGTTGKQREMLTECVEAGRAITQKAIDDVRWRIETGRWHIETLTGG